MKQPTGNAHPEYIPPSRLVKCLFDSKQTLFWSETSEWFWAYQKFNESAANPDDDWQANSAMLNKAIPEKYHKEIWRTHQSVFQAFYKVQSKELGIDTKNYPKGASDKGTYNHSEERQKKFALMAIKNGSKLWNPQVYPVIKQAIRENDVDFFSRDLPETLRRRKVICFNPDEPERGILSHWMVSFWCPSDYWPAWADSNLPPLCIFTDEAIAEFLSSGEDYPGKTTVEAVQQCRKRHGLKRFTRTVRIKKVSTEKGSFLFHP